jgi:hypothetical protein
MKLHLITSLSILSICFTYAQKETNAIFESSKGRWPVPVPKYVKIENNEERKHYTANQFDSILRINTDSGYYVRAVHDATVIEVFNSDSEYTIVTKFADYFISYSSFSRSNLLKGQKIKQGQIIGKLIKGDWIEKYFTLQIMLTKGRKQLSAFKWINWKRRIT